MKKIPVRKLEAAQTLLHSTGKFTIRRVEDITAAHDLVHELHRHDFYFILALEKATGVHEIDFTACKVLNNAVFFLRPGQVHRLELKKGCSGFLVEFDAAFYHPIDKLALQRFIRAGNRNYCLFENRRFNKLKTVLASMYEEYTEKDEWHRDVIHSNLTIFFIEYLRQRPDAKEKATTINSYTQERFEEFVDLLNKHAGSNKQVAHYIHLMNLSSYQLNQITRTAIGKTASDVINEHIVLEAKRQLLATPNQVKEIAHQLGYEDPSYFIRFFKKHTGHSPDAFRDHFK